MRVLLPFVTAFLLAGAPLAAQDQASARQSYQEAETAFEAERYDRAMELVDEAKAALRSDNARLSAMRIRIHYAQGNYVAAKEELVRFRRMESSDALWEEMGQLETRIKAGEGANIRERLAQFAPEVDRLKRLFSPEWRTKGGHKASFEMHRPTLYLFVGPPHKPGTNCVFEIRTEYAVERDGQRGRNNVWDRVYFESHLRTGDLLVFSADPHADMQGDPMVGYPYIGIRRDGQFIKGRGGSFNMKRRGKKRTLGLTTSLIPLYLPEKTRPNYDPAKVEQAFRRIADLCGIGFEKI